jgi:pimeloyl-ACP methyl ester carboxylesterase
MLRKRTFPSARAARLLGSAVVLLGLAALAAGCGGGSDAPPSVLDASSCAAISDLAFVGTEITTAEWNEATAGQGGSQGLPARCRLRGVLDRRTGADGASYGTGFELRLPAEWKERLYFQGGFGTDGAVTAAIGYSGRGSALGRGHAVVSTDAGHSGGGPEFGLDPRARIDFGHAALDRVARFAKDVLARVYGRGPARSYFVGCSNGGRQAFVAAQRFPDLFDGIVAGAPGFNLPRAAVGEAWNTQAVAAIATTQDPNGKPYLPGTFSAADLALLAEGILDACDALDGLVDGMVDDLPGCRFSPATLRCPGAKDPTCLDAGQVGALERIFGGARNAAGEELYVGFPWDPGVGDPSPIGSLRGWTLGNPAVPVNSALNVTLGAGALAFIFVTPPVDTADPFAFALSFDFDRDAPKIFATAGDYAESSVEFMTATSTDLSAFARRGGKLLVYHGAADGVFSVNDTIRWYEGVTADTEDAADVARLFVVPGMGHCGGGPATDSFDAFAALEAWVERDEAPDRLLATASATTPFAGRTRPLCPWPKQSRYRGEGSIEGAESFECR